MAVEKKVKEIIESIDDTLVVKPNLICPACGWEWDYTQPRKGPKKVIGTKCLACAATLVEKPVEKVETKIVSEV